MAPNEQPTTVLVHTEERHKETSGGWVEYDYSTEYHFVPDTGKVIVREFSSCDNTRDHRRNYDHRKDAEFTLEVSQTPEVVRQKIKLLLNTPSTPTVK
jgi:hypothetical protein